MNLARSSLRLFAARAASSLIVFLGITYFARELGSYQIGVFFLFQALLGMVAIPADFGINSGVTKRLSEGESSGSILSTAILLKAMLLFPFVVGIVLLRGPINDYLGADLALLLVLALVLQESGKLTTQVLKGELRVGETAGPLFSRKFVYVSVGVILISLGFGVQGIVYGLIAGSFVMLCWGALRSSTTLGSPSLGHARSLFDYSKYAFVSSAGGYLYNWLDVVVIGFFLTQSHVGAYEIAWRVTTVVILFSNAIASAVFPQVSKWAADDAREKIEVVIKEVLSPSLIFVIPAFFGTLILSQDILRIIFGEEYTTAWLVLILLMGDKVFQAVQVIVGRSLQAINRPDLAARAALASLTINIILNIILVWRFGIIGAAIGTVISSVINDILNIIYLSGHISLQFPCHLIGWSIMSSLIMFSVLLAIKSLIVVRSLPILVGMISVGAVVYLSIILISSSIRTKAKRQVSRIFLR